MVIHSFIFHSIPLLRCCSAYPVSLLWRSSSHTDPQEVQRGLHSAMTAVNGAGSSAALCPLISARCRFLSELCWNRAPTLEKAKPPNVNVCTFPKHGGLTNHKFSFIWDCGWLVGNIYQWTHDGWNRLQILVTQQGHILASIDLAPSLQRPYVHTMHLLCWRTLRGHSAAKNTPKLGDH